MAVNTIAVFDALKESIQLERGDNQGAENRHEQQHAFSGDAKAVVDPLGSDEKGSYDAAQIDAQTEQHDAGHGKDRERRSNTRLGIELLQQHQQKELEEQSQLHVIGGEKPQIHGGEE